MDKKSRAEASKVSVLVCCVDSFGNEVPSRVAFKSAASLLCVIGLKTYKEVIVLSLLSWGAVAVTIQVLQCKMCLVIKKLIILKQKETMSNRTADYENHPEGGIMLRDGSVIEGYTPQQILEEADNTMSLDTTGVYFSLRKPPIKRPEEKRVQTRRNEAEMIFLKNAWYFYEHYQEICADSRKFLARVPVQSGLAYTGTGGFRNPTLGVYVEWWHSFKKAIVELDGDKWLVWHIAGSPLSGMNKCGLVNAEGKVQCHSVNPFPTVWHSFVEINTRYDECKAKYMAFTIEEVAALMHGDLDETSRSFLGACFGLRSQVASLSDDLKRMTAQAAQLRYDLVTTKIKYNERELYQIYDKYLSEKDLRKVRRDQLLESRLDLRKRFKGGHCGQIEYQRTLYPISKELKALAEPLEDREVPKLKSMGLTLRDVINYFEQENQNNNK